MGQTNGLKQAVQIGCIKFSTGDAKPPVSGSILVCPLPFDKTGCLWWMHLTAKMQTLFETLEQAPKAGWLTLFDSERALR